MLEYINMAKIKQLYEFFQPHNYKLTLDLDRKARKFYGEIIVTGTTKKEQPSISLHAKGLKISQATIDGQEAKTKLGKDDELVIKCAKPIESGKHVIKIKFSGEIHDSQHGIYPCYFKHSGVKKELLATQLEPHHAREILPCVDEPAAKATFDVTLKTETGITVLGNMPTKEQFAEDSKLVTRFRRTPRMSTYLLAFVAGELHKVSDRTKSGVEVNVWAAPSQKNKDLKFALECAVRNINFFDNYFGCHYPLPKSDHVALPDMGGGASAAMENWGLITYREDYLIADEHTGISVRQRIARVTSHETSHQWFGNLVTMQWWDDLWLNESFASLMEFVAKDNLFPQWNVWQNFPTSETLPALRRDSNPGVQPIKTGVNHPDEIGTIFDGAIVYAKGSAVLRMLQVYVGDEAFQDGLRRYFQSHSYGNTKGSDLWKALGETVPDFVTPWLEQSGFPVVSVSKKDEKTLKLHQSEFLIGGKSDPKKLWPIPLHASDKKLPKIFDTKDMSVEVSSDDVLINSGGHGQYIVNYDSDLRQKLINRTKAGDLPQTDRLRLLMESTLLMRTDHMETADIVDVLSAFSHEDKQPVWDIMGLAISDLRQFVTDNEKAEAGLKKLARNISSQLADSLGWDEKPDESEAVSKLRGNVLALAIYGENKKVIKEAIKRYDEAKDDVNKLNGEIRSLILTATVRHGGYKNIIDDLLKAHDKTHNSELQEDIATGLTSTKNPEEIKKLLDIMADSKKVRPQNAVHWLVYLFRNRYGRKQTWEWMRENWDWVEKTYGDDKSYEIFPRIAGSILNTHEELEEYKTFFKPLLKEPSLKRTINIGISEITARAEWIEKDKAKLLEALKKL